MNEMGDRAGVIYRGHQLELDSVDVLGSGLTELLSTERVSAVSEMSVTEIGDMAGLICRNIQRIRFQIAIGPTCK